MSLFSSIKSLFTPKPQPEEVYDAEEYKGFTITPAPQAENGQYRVKALIQKDEQTHTLIRADLFPNKDQCIEVSLRKARQTIDEQGERLFG